MAWHLDFVFNFVQHQKPHIKPWNFCVIAESTFCWIGKVLRDFPYRSEFKCVYERPATTNLIYFHVFSVYCGNATVCIQNKSKGFSLQYSPTILFFEKLKQNHFSLVVNHTCHSFMKRRRNNGFSSLLPLVKWHFTAFQMFALHYWTKSLSRPTESSFDVTSSRSNKAYTAVACWHKATCC